MTKPLRCILPLLFISLLWLPGVARALPPEPVEEATRAVLRQLCDAVSRRDLSAALACVTNNAVQREGPRGYLEAEIARPGDLRLALDRFRLRQHDEVSALGRARMSWTRAESKAATPKETQATWDLRFIRELGEWKLWAFRFAEDHLYALLVAADSREERKVLLEADADLLGGWLPYELRDAAEQRAREQKFVEAERLADLALEVSEQMNSDFERGYSHLVRGYVRERKKAWNPALDAYDAALQYFQKLKDPAAQGKVWRNSARVYAAVGRYKQAVPAWERAVTFFRQASYEAEEADALQDLGFAYQAGGRYAEAIPAYEAALAIQRRRKNRKLEAVLLGNIAAVRISLEQYAEALSGIEAARRIHQEIGNHGSDSLLLTNTGNIYQALGKIPEARAAYRGAVEAARAGSDKHDLIIALHNLATFHSINKQPEEALAPEMEALALAKEVNDSSLDVQAWLLLGSVGMELGKLEPARESFETALQEARAAGQEAAESTALLSLGVIAHKQRQTPAALKYLSDARTIAVRLGVHLEIGRTWLNEAVIYRDEGDWAHAAQAFERATRAIEETRDQTRVRSLQTSYFRQFAHLYGELAQCYLNLGQPEKAFAAAERLKGRSLVDVIQGGNVRLGGATTAEERKREQELEDLLVQQASAVQLTTSTDARLALLEDREKTRGELEAYRETLYLRHPELRTQRAAFSPATPEELGTALLSHSPRTAILSFVVRPQETLLFVLHRERAGQTRLAHHRIPLSQRKLLEWTDSLWEGCSTAGGEYEPPARFLFRTLIGPAAAELGGKDHLVLIPDSDLGVLPFAALLDAADTPLAAKYSLSYAASATALLKMAQQRSASNERTSDTLLAFGAPIFPKGMPDLPESLGEVTALGKLFGKGATILTGVQATETTARQRMGGARYVHFATHGTLDQNVPMESAVVLTRDPMGDGFLRARELAELDLHADLVVLSACETALGQKVRGEGVVGLTWALFVGGARSSITTQWQVADESTPALMLAFYRRLRSADHPTKAVALRQAQLSLLRGKQYRHPYYWAPFALTGSWQ